MNRSLAVAILISVAVHLFALLGMLRDADRFQPGATPTLIRVSIAQPEDRNQRGSAAADIASAGDPGEQPAAAAATTAPDPGPGVAPESELAPASENTLAEVHQAPGIAASPAPQNPAPEVDEAPAAATKAQPPPSADAPPMLASLRPRERLVPPRVSSPPTPETVTMSEQEQQMLAGQLRKWTETYYQRAPTDPGIAWEYQGKRYSAAFLPEPAASDMGIERVVVQVSTEEDGRTLSARMRMKRLAFSNFAQFVDYWDPEVQIHDDELDGRFHANSTIHLGYGRQVRPSFQGKVTTSSRGIDTSEAEGRFRREQIFQGGLETGVRKILLPKRFLPPGEADVDPEQVRELEKHTSIVFYADGSYGWQDLESNAPEVRGRLSDKTTYLLGASKKKLYVRGVIKGRVLVYSPERLIIAGSLTYADEPDGETAGGDYLGLVCDKTIEVAHPDVTGRGDLAIHGAIYAGRRFAINGYRLREHAVLSIYGSLTAGTLSATEPRFATRIRFDPRLESTRPPGFPMSDRYEIEAWDGEWEVEVADGGS